MPVDLFKAGREVGDESQEWVFHPGLIAFLVGDEPITVVVGLELFQKAERGAREMTILRCCLACGHPISNPPIDRLLASWFSGARSASPMIPVRLWCSQCYLVVDLLRKRSIHSQKPQRTFK